jgi:hypothetical protein
MKTITMFSLRRRHLTMAAAACVATPASAFTILRGGTAVAPAIGAAGIPRQGEKLVVSGRVVDATGKAVTNVALEAWHPGVHGTTVTTDGDGRVMFTTTTPADVQGIRYRITRADSHVQEGRLRIDVTAAGRDATLSHLHRDDAGVWRSTFALTLA